MFLPEPRQRQSFKKISLRKKRLRRSNCGNAFLNGENDLDKKQAAQCVICMKLI
jgi:hypothetical protein